MDALTSLSQSIDALMAGTTPANTIPNLPLKNPQPYPVKLTLTTANIPKSKPSLQKKPTVTATSVLEPLKIREMKEEERAETQEEEKNVEEEGRRETTKGCDSERGDDGVTIDAEMENEVEEALNELAKAQSLMMDDEFQALLEGVKFLARFIKIILSPSTKNRQVLPIWSVHKK